MRANGQLIIHHLVSTDPDVLAGAHRAAERTGSDDVTAFVTSALGVGAKALAVADTNLDLAELDRSVQAFTGQVFQVTSAALGPRRAGHRPGRRHRRPRARHRRLAGQITELRTALEVEKATSLVAASASAKAPTHGLDYETAVLDRLDQIAYTAGDSLTRTGTTPGAIPRALTGDAVIELAANPALPGRGASLVVECKDRGRRTSPATWPANLPARSRQSPRCRRTRPAAQPRADARRATTPPHPQPHRVPGRL